MARVHVLKETTVDPSGNWQLWLQWCRFDLDEAGNMFGYRFIYKRPTGELQGARGQARLPSFDKVRRLMAQAESEGWGDGDGDEVLAAAERAKSRGAVVSLVTGYVGWPDRATAIAAPLTEEMVADAKLIARWA